MDKLDRKDLKHDHFVEEVQHLVDVAAINKGRDVYKVLHFLNEVVVL